MILSFLNGFFLVLLSRDLVFYFLHFFAIFFVDFFHILLQFCRVRGADLAAAGGCACLWLNCRLSCELISNASRPPFSALAIVHVTTALSLAEGQVTGSGDVIGGVSIKCATVKARNCEYELRHFATQI